MLCNYIVLRVHVGVVAKVGVFANIDGNRINLEAELFSLDGSKRFHLKSCENVDKTGEIGIEMGKTLKKMSNNSYKK